METFHLSFTIIIFGAILVSILALILKAKKTWGKFIIEDNSLGEDDSLIRNLHIHHQSFVDINPDDFRRGEYYLVRKKYTAPSYIVPELTVLRSYSNYVLFFDGRKCYPRNPDDMYGTKAGAENYLRELSVSFQWLKITIN